MPLEDYFQISKAEREDVISRIVRTMPESIRADEYKRIEAVVNLYVGKDGNLLTILSEASVKGLVDEYVTKFENHYQEVLNYVPPHLRRDTSYDGVRKTDDLFLQCHRDIIRYRRD